VALWTADSADELHRALVLRLPALGDASDAFEPLMLLRAAHRDRPDGAAQTALLLLTDSRWRRATSRLVRAIDESGLVPEEHLDLLARAFLAANDTLYWKAPAEWFDGPEITLRHPEATCDRNQPSEPDDAPVMIARRVPPPVRRWAAARLLRADPSAWSGIVKRAKELDSTAAAAVVAGLVDAADALAPAARDVVLELALTWGARGPRLAALDHLARHGQPERASQRARQDPDAAIRRWGQKLTTRPHLPAPHPPSRAGASIGPAECPNPAGPKPATLF
jgi:hypothetical protein